MELSGGARKIFEEAVRKKEQLRHNQLGLHHFLLVILSSLGAMAQGTVTGLDARRYRQELEAKLQAGDIGEAIDPETLRQQIIDYARAQGKSLAYERDVACVLLQKAGWTLSEPTATPDSSPLPMPDDTRVQRFFGYRPRAKHPTPYLDQIGRDLTRQALEGKLSPVVGRENEIQTIIEVLCRRTKRNPVLVGPGGTGKTAIVEGLAQRIVRGEVPEPLQNVRLIEIPVRNLTAGAGIYGELEQRVQKVIQEASQDGIIIFIDEVHSTVGAGDQYRRNDLANHLKPALARGDVACIAATTDDEYRKHIESDSALERRFNPIRVNELSAEQTLEVLRALSHAISEECGITIQKETLTQIIDYATRYLRNRYFPDKAVDVLDQCVAAARAQGKASVDATLVQEVVERMAGVPNNLPDRLDRLSESLRKDGLLHEEQIEALIGRLLISTSGLDFRPQRPNAIVLLVGDLRGQEDNLARLIASEVLGSEERVITIDLAAYTDPSTLMRLIGSPPSYIGYGDATPLHRVAQMPWCVLLLKNLQACHPVIRDLLAQGLRDGFLTDGRGKHIYLSDAILIVTALLEAEECRSVGLRPVEEQRTDWRTIVKKTFGNDWSALPDIIVPVGKFQAENLSQRIPSQLIEEATERYQARGVELRWDKSVIEWLNAQHPRCSTREEWERAFETTILSQLERILARIQKELPQQERRYRVQLLEGQIRLFEISTEGGASKDDLSD